MLFNPIDSGWHIEGTLLTFFFSDFDPHFKARTRGWLINARDNNLNQLNTFVFRHSQSGPEIAVCQTNIIIKCCFHHNYKDITGLWMSNPHPELSGSNLGEYFARLVVYLSPLQSKNRRSANWMKGAINELLIRLTDDKEKCVKMAGYLLMRRLAGPYDGLGWLSPAPWDIISVIFSMLEWASLRGVSAVRGHLSSN